MTRTFVKPKLTHSPASPDSGDLQLKIAMDDIQAKAAEEQDLQEAAFGAPDHFELKLDIPVLPAECKGRRTSLIARYILGIIIAKVGYGWWGYLSEETIAREARCGLWPVKNAKKQLEEAGLLDVNRRGKCHRYHVPKWVKRLPKTWVNPALVRDNGLSITEAVDLSDLKFRQGKNYATWPTIQERAELLGVSYHTIARADTSIAALGYIQRRHRPWRRSSKNEYCLTCKGKEATGVFEPESARPNARALGQTTKEEDLVYANKARNGSLHSRFGLSFSPDQDQKPYKLLVCIGVNRFVAKPVAAQHRRDPESVENMIWNWTGKTEQSRRYWQGKGLPAPRIPLAGYVVGGLNIGIAECHPIKLSPVGKEAKAKAQGKLAAAAVVRPTEAELKKLEQYAENVLKPCLAKTPTPGKSAILAQYTPICDKKVQDALLTRTLETAKRNWAAHHKPANLPQKGDFSLDKPG